MTLPRLSLATMTLWACTDRLPPGLDEAPARALGGPMVSFDPLASGAAATLTVDGADPFDDVVFTVGRSPGVGPCPSALGGVCLGTDNPHLLGRTVADAAGHAELAWVVPIGLGGRTVALQAAIPRGPGGVDSVLTPVVQATVDGTDADGDGFDAGVDCDDADDTVYPGADEVCDGVDTDCDASTGEDGLVSIGAVNYPTVADAVWVAAPDATVNVCAGTYAETLYADRPVRLVGVAGAASTTIDAAGANAPVLILDGPGTYLVEGLTLTGGTAGVLVFDGLDLTVRRAVITGNHSTTSGSGIAEFSSSGSPPTLRIEDTEISDNHCTTGAASLAAGGGVYAANATVTMDGAVFRDNSADLGGAAYLSTAAVTITESTFHGNASSGDGGGLYLYALTADMAVVDSDFGTGADENTPDDIFISGNRYTWFGAGESFTCSASTRTCQ